MFSLTGARLAARSGILDLMDDLGRAMTTDPGMRMLGGGNPAHIPAVDAVWRRRMAELMSDGDALERMPPPVPYTIDNGSVARAMAGAVQEINIRNTIIALGPRNVATPSRSNRLCL